MGTKVIPREVGKIITHSRELRELRRTLRLSDAQRKVVVGTLLGDGCLIPNSWGKQYRVQIEHSAAQKGNVFWKYRLLRSFVLPPPQFNERNQSWKFRSISHPEFTELASKFYDLRRRKILPDIALQDLQDPFVLAVWYMDDGGLRKERGRVYGAFLNSQSFSATENTLLQERIRDIFGVKTLVLQNHRKPRIYIPGYSVERFMAIISPHTIDSMRFKI